MKNYSNVSLNAIFTIDFFLEKMLPYLPPNKRQQVISYCKQVANLHNTSPINVIGIIADSEWYDLTLGNCYNNQNLCNVGDKVSNIKSYTGGSDLTQNDVLLQPQIRSNGLYFYDSFMTKNQLSNQLVSSLFISNSTGVEKGQIYKNTHTTSGGWGIGYGINTQEESGNNIIGLIEFFTWLNSNTTSSNNFEFIEFSRENNNNYILQNKNIIFSNSTPIREATDQGYLGGVDDRRVKNVELKCMFASSNKIWSSIERNIIYDFLSLFYQL